MRITSLVLLALLSGCDSDRGREGAASKPAVPPLPSGDRPQMERAQVDQLLQDRAKPQPDPVVREFPTGAEPERERLAMGQRIYDRNCSACHETGATNAPKVANLSVWQERVAKGEATLYAHAIEGYKGNEGFHPPCGGNPVLTDDEVKAAVDFMLLALKRQPEAR